jgi:hypothetical protein
MWTAPPSAKVSLNDPLRYRHAAGLAELSQGRLRLLSERR